LDHAEVGDRAAHLVAQPPAQALRLVRGVVRTGRGFGEGQDDAHARILAARGSVYPRVMPSFDPAEQARLVARLQALRTEHRDLDAAVARLQRDAGADELMVKRLKRRKLQLKDAMEWVESALIPDEPA